MSEQPIARASDHEVLPVPGAEPVVPASTPARSVTRDVILELRGIHTYYGKIHALQGIDLDVHDGEIVTLIGSNGAGKTTTLKTISGLLHPRDGTVRFAGGVALAAGIEDEKVGVAVGKLLPVAVLGDGIDRKILLQHL